MKKIVSLLLCVLFVCALPAAARADNASCFSVSGISVDASMEGQTLSLDFKDLAFIFSLVEDEAGQLAVINIFDGDKLLLSGSGTLDGRRLYFTVDGLSHTYYADIPVEDDTANSASGSGISLSEEELQAIVEQLMEQLEINQDGTTTTFRLPYTAVNQLLEQLLPVFAQIPTLDSDTLDKFESAIAEMKETDSGIELNGSFNFSDTSFSGVVNVLMVDNGVAADAPAAYVNFEATVGSEISVKGDLNVQDEGGYTQPIAFTLTIGETVDFELLSADATLHASFDPASSRLLLEFHQDKNQFTLGATVGMSDRELTVCPLGDLAEALDVQSLDEEQMNALQAEFSSAAADLVGTVVSVLMSAGLVE